MKELVPDQSEMLLQTLKARFEKEKRCAKAITWSAVQIKLEASPENNGH